MMYARILLVGLLLLLVEGQIGTALAQHGPTLGVYPLLGTPSLLLPLIASIALRESSVPKGLGICLLLGMMHDVAANAPSGLLSLCTVVAWVVSRSLGGRLVAPTLTGRLALVLLLSLLEAGLMLALLTILGRDPEQPLALARTAAGQQVLSTVLIAGPVFVWIDRLEGLWGGRKA
jgi:hypothetical protein